MDLFKLCFLSFFLPLICFSQSQSPERYKDWVWGGPIDPLQEKYEVKRYDLRLELLPEEEKLDGRVKVHFSTKVALDTLRLNLIDFYNVSLVMGHNQPLSYNHFGDTLDIFLGEEDTSEVTVFYSGITPIAAMPPWKGGFTWTKDNNDNHWVGLSCQGEGAKIFMPCLDHPSSEPWEGVDIQITVPYPYFVASNGRLLGSEKTTEGIKYHWSTDYPVNNYCINFTMGIFHLEERVYNSVNGKQIPMAVYVLEENKEKAPELLDILERSTRTHEKYFGPYPFPDDKIAIVETPYLGMEHQTINAYGNKFNYGKVEDVKLDWLLHHELGHEWWGNMVTVKDWSHYWIHEGICTYGDWLFYLEHGGEDAYMKHVGRYGASIMNLNPVVAQENANSDEAYHIDVYYKGAFIMHSLRFIIGDEVFFPMLKDFLGSKNYTYDQQVTTEDFTEFVENYSGKDLQGFFDLYLYTTDVPNVIIEEKANGKYLVSIPNIGFTLPMEVKTADGTKVFDLSAKPVEIQSATKPEVDPNGWFLKEVTKK